MLSHGLVWGCPGLLVLLTVRELEVPPWPPALTWWSAPCTLGSCSAETVVGGGGYPMPVWSPSCCLSQRPVFLCFQGEDLDFWLSATPLPAAAPAPVRAWGAACAVPALHVRPAALIDLPLRGVQGHLLWALPAPGVRGCWGTLAQTSQTWASLVPRLRSGPVSGCRNVPQHRARYS